jgi:hypothetical protein
MIYYLINGDVPNELKLKKAVLKDKNHLLSSFVLK